MIEYFVFTKNEVRTFYRELTTLMGIVLSDNISQRYPESLPEDYVKKMENYVQDGSAFVVGAKENANLAGFSWAYALDIFDERRFHIDMICVHPSYRKRGIAKQLVNMQIGEAERRGIQVVEAMTTRNNENSYNWFHSLGFEDERVKVKLEIKK